ncbi:VWA domain-containing protein [Aurantimonas aggregata]|uniref:VWA domain-containing protein n=1 Tax=Aurantimonas aggregata TaxID=2047720 RepID=A0A6L9MCW4_9HYPH|nr:VWA domain-containing protein [Aurantimonas aggregata]NDV85352.1 VWA domain-containing protein [Aurantimonas aggregata]
MSDALVLLRPYWLLALPLIALVAMIVARRSRGLAGWERAVDPRLLAAMQRLGSVVPGTARRTWLPILIAAPIVLGLAGPGMRDANPPTFRNLDGIVLAMDVSRSVAEGGGLEDAKAAAQLVLQRAGARPVMLIVFAGDAFVATAFTTDPEALGSTLAVLDAETVPATGSRPDRALALARQTLADANILNGDVVLITDGDGLGPATVAETETMRAAGMHVSTIFVEPTERPGDMPVPDPAGLQRMAEAGDGFYAAANEPWSVAEGIGQRAASRLESSDYAVLFVTDYGRYLLILALFPALGLFRRTS